MKRIILSGILALTTLATHSAMADRIVVKVTNLTSAIYFTPLIAVAHKSSLDVFESGHAASPALRAIAEGGDVSGLKAAAESAGAATAVAGGLTAPGTTTILHLDASRHLRYLSVAGMLLPTNDGFVGVDSIYMPRRGYRKINALGYDAGTESNEETITGGGAPGVRGIPADPGGNAGSGGSGVSGSAADGGPHESHVIHIHRGILGDRDAFGGESDLDSAVHSWDGAVARVEIYRYRGRHGGK